jgi:tRNA (adenine37-N6)-methyltransferase
VFATRSPHRVNPIGLSKAKVLEVREDGILIDEIDLVDGTPILDIKPCVKEDMPWEEVKMPTWLEETKQNDIWEVTIHSKAKEQLRELINHSLFYSDLEQVISLVSMTLSINPLSSYDLNAHKETSMYAVELDAFNFLYTLNSKEK